MWVVMSLLKMVEGLFGSYQPLNGVLIIGKNFGECGCPATTANKSKSHTVYFNAGHWIPGAISRTLASNALYRPPRYCADTLTS